jgi:hypothetical protein
MSLVELYRIKLHNKYPKTLKDGACKTYNCTDREGKRVFIDEQAYLRWQKRNSFNYK